MNAISQRSLVIVNDKLGSDSTLIRSALKSVDVDIVEISSGDEICRCIDENQQNIALLLLNTDGVDPENCQIAQTLFAQNANHRVPVLFITQHDHDNKGWFKRYAQITIDCVAKPLDEDTLRAKVGIFLDLYRKGKSLNLLNQNLQHHYKKLKIEVCERLKTEEKLNKSLELIKQSPVLVVVADAKGKIEFVNTAFQRMTGYTTEDVVGENITFHLQESNDASIKATLENAISTHQQWSGEVLNKKKHGGVYWSYTSISPLFDDDHNIINILCIEEDITSRKNYEDNLLKKANFDEITKLPNRILALDRLSKSLIDKQSESVLCPIFFIDIDGLRRINETLGHDSGDDILLAISKRLKRVVRSNDIIARIGSDEFLVIPRGANDVNDATILAKKIIKKIEEPILIDGHLIHMSACIGVNLEYHFNDDPQIAIQNAESAMYRAKEQGSGSFQFFDDAISKSIQEKIRIEFLLHKAIDNDEFYLFFQPIVDTKTKKMVSVEALLRWNSKEIGMISPEVFVPVAETSGQINSLGSWVLNRIEKYVDHWLTKIEKINVAINVSVNQFHDYKFHDEVEKVYERNKSLKRNFNLEIEITERILMNDNELITEKLQGIRDMGFSLSIDDFGTGYSSLSHLKRCPVSIVKIDKSFINELPDDKENITLVKTIVAMAHGLGLAVVAEGVETSSQWLFLKEIGCDYCQGYYFSRPMSEEDFNCYITENSIGEES